MDVFERIRWVRKYRGIPQKEVASWFGISTPSYGRKERGIEGGFGPSELNLYIEKMGIDSRFLFGQLDDISKADLTSSESENKTYEKQLIDAVTEYNKIKNPLKELDPILIRIKDDEAVKSIARLLIEHRNLIPGVEGYIFAKLEDLQPQSARASESGSARKADAKKGEDEEQAIS